MGLKPFRVSPQLLYSFSRHQILNELKKIHNGLELERLADRSNINFYIKPEAEDTRPNTNYKKLRFLDLRPPLTGVA